MVGNDYVDVNFEDSLRPWVCFEYGAVLSLVLLKKGVISHDSSLGPFFISMITVKKYNLGEFVFNYRKNVFLELESQNSNPNF